MSSLQHNLQHWLPVLQTRWQRGRRSFDARMLTERRLIVVAVAAVIWLLMDNLCVTPGYKSLTEAIKEKGGLQGTYDKFKSLALQREAEIKVKQQDAARDLQNMRNLVRERERELQQVQSMLAPAKEMRQMLEGMLAQQGQLRIKSMSTVPPKEVSLGIGSKADEKIQLYQHGMNITVEGSFADMLAWLKSLETMPHRLLWDSIALHSDDQAQLSLSIVVHTFSPDRDALEIAP
jgi:MSHA biogenesis protein MshJ